MSIGYREGGRVDVLCEYLSPIHLAYDAFKQYKHMSDSYEDKHVRLRLCLSIVNPISLTDLPLTGLPIPVLRALARSLT